jgi:hypothetical protein
MVDVTTTPTNAELADIDVFLAASAMRRRPRMWKVAGVCLLLAAGGAYALHAAQVPASLMSSASVGTAAVGAAPLPTVTTPAAATVDPAPSVLDVEVAKTNSPAAPTTPKTEPSASPSRKPRSKSHHPTNSTEEIDVGF